MTDKAHKAIKRIAGHMTAKLTTFELLFAASEYEKFEVKNLIAQMDNVELTADEKEALLAQFASFEETSLTTPWNKAAPTVR